MIVSVNLTIDVDPESWTRAYGVEGPTEIREDVRSFVLTAVQESSPSDEGGFKSVKLNVARVRSKSKGGQ